MFGLDPENCIDCIGVKRHESVIERLVYTCVVVIVRNIFNFMNEVVKPVIANF